MDLGVRSQRASDRVARVGGRPSAANVAAPGHRNRTKPTADPRPIRRPPLQACSASDRFSRTLPLTLCMTFRRRGGSSCARSSRIQRDAETAFSPAPSGWSESHWRVFTGLRPPPMGLVNSMCARTPRVESTGSTDRVAEACLDISPRNQHIA